MIGGGTYGPMGGQAAAGEVAGELEGYKAVEGIKDNSQRRKMRQEEWAIKKDALMDKAQQSHMQLMAQQKQAVESGAFSPQNMEYLNNQVKALEQKVQKGDKTFIDGLIEKYLGSSAPDEELKGINASLNNNPEMKQKLGLKGEARPVEISSAYDREKMVNHLMKTDDTFATLSPEKQKAVIDREIATKNYVVGDQHIVDMKGLAIGMGTWNTMSTDAKAKNAKREAGNTVATNVEAAQAPGKSTTAEPPAEPQVAAYEHKPEAVKAKANKYGYANSGNEIDTLVDEFGLDIKSGHRDEEANKKAGGASKSQHVGGEAYDVDIRGKSKEEIDQIIRRAGELGFTSFGTGANSLHIDRRANPASWGYAGGKSSGSGPALPEHRQAIADAQKSAKGYSVSPGPEAEVSGWENKPYSSSSSSSSEQDSNRQRVLNNLAGWSNTDDRTALMKDMDYIADQMGPDTTMGEVQEVYKALKFKGDDGGSNAKYPTFEYAKEHILGNTVKEFGPDWRSNPQAVKQHASKMDDAEERFIGAGTPEVKNIYNDRVIARGMDNWDAFKRGGYKGGDTLDNDAKATQNRLLNSDTENKSNILREYKSRK